VAGDAIEGVVQAAHEAKLQRTSPGRGAPWTSRRSTPEVPNGIPPRQQVPHLDPLQEPPQDKSNSLPLAATKIAGCLQVGLPARPELTMALLSHGFRGLSGTPIPQALLNASGN
jgi:hypothetical protein